MKNYAMPLAIAIVGLGLMSIGFNLNGNQAVATPAVFNVGPEERTIVWYDTFPQYTNEGNINNVLSRAWSDGTVEQRYVCFNGNCGSPSTALLGDWTVIASPNEGLNAAADINFDERVDGSDLAQVLAYWGDAPRNDYPPSDCPLGLIH